MSRFAVKNDDDEYLFGHHQWGKPGQILLTYSNITSANNDAIIYNGHAVELGEKPAPIVVNQEEADMLKRAKSSLFQETSVIDQYVKAHGAAEFGCDIGDRLMRAYVNGYTVAKEKKYVVYKDLGGKHNTNVQYAQAHRTSAHSETFSWIITPWILNTEDTNGSSFQFTESEIEHYGLQDCEKEEVTDDEQ